MPTINKRIDELEKSIPKNTNHHYEVNIHWEKEAEYFRDGKPISRAQYFAEAPREVGKINIHWVEVNPERGNDANNQKPN